MTIMAWCAKSCHVFAAFVNSSAAYYGSWLCVKGHSFWMDSLSVSADCVWALCFWYQPTSVAGGCRAVCEGVYIYMRSDGYLRTVSVQFVCSRCACVG